MSLAGFIFVASFLAMVYFGRECWRAFRSPEFKRDLERLRAQRRSHLQMRRDLKDSQEVRKWFPK